MTKSQLALVIMVFIYSSICQSYRRFCKVGIFNNARLRMSTSAATGSKSPVQDNEEFELHISDLTNLGSGVGRRLLPSDSTWVVMVPLVLPGEDVMVRIVRNHSSYSVAELVRVINASPARIEPQCKYFTQCGGCQYQHMDVSTQRDWKRSQVKAALQRVGGLPDVVVNSAVGTEHVYEYRTKLTPHYSITKGPRVVQVGFRRRESHELVDVTQCPIASPAVNTAYSDERRRLHNSTSQVKGKKSGGTLLLREDGSGVVHTDQAKEVACTVNGLKFQFKAGEFFQNNPFVLPLLVAHVVERAVGEGDCVHLIDAYCGSGLFALSAAARFQAVLGVEVSATAVDSAKRNAKRNGIQNAEFVAGAAERIFASTARLSAGECAVVLDPPRRGCVPAFLQQLLAFRPRRIVYVSCDPATQARDAKVLVAAGYTIADATPFDLFPQTRHIENVITFTRIVIAN